MKYNKLTVLLLILSFSGLSYAETVTEYFPVAEKGRTWEYVITKNRVTEVDGRKIPEQINGTTIEESRGTVAEAKLPEPVILLVQNLSETSGRTQKTRKGKLESYLRVSPGEILILAQRMSGVPQMGDKMNIFKAPVALLKLPLPKAGEAYPSIMETQGMRFDSRPYEKTYESVTTPAGVFRDCMRIKTRGKISGSIPGPNPMRVESGQVEETLWFAKGVGLVKNIQRMQMVLVLPNGKKFSTKEKKEKKLTKYSK